MFIDLQKNEHDVYGNKKSNKRVFFHVLFSVCSSSLGQHSSKGGLPISIYSLKDSVAWRSLKAFWNSLSEGLRWSLINCAHVANSGVCLTFSHASEHVCCWAIFSSIAWIAKSAEMQKKGNIFLNSMIKPFLLA